MTTLYKSVLLLLSLCACSYYLRAQDITLPDGTPIPVQYCWTDENHLIAGQPSGGVFSGCGVFQESGQWYFNPVTATQGTTVFPVQCNITYTSGSTVINKLVLIWKPVVVSPPLRDSFTCNGKLRLSATMLYAGAYDFAWSPATGLEVPDSPVTRGYIDATQTFVLTATDKTSGCTGSDTITIHRRPVPVISVSPDTAILPLTSIQLKAEGALYYKWQPDQWLDRPTTATPLATPQAPVTYTVNGVNEYGCSASAQVSIRLIEGFLVPNAFSPNGDGLNDEFRISNAGYHEILELRIFNRWGQQVFHNFNSNKGWDGRINGQPADAGTYHYYLRMQLRKEKVQVFKGDLQLLR